MGLKRVQICVNEGYMTEVEVPSRSDPDRVYVVVVQDPEDEEEVVCECEGYQFRGHCSHQKEALDRVRESACAWMTGEQPRQTPDQRRSNICPQCGGPTEWTSIDRSDCRRP